MSLTLDPSADGSYANILINGVAKLKISQDGSVDAVAGKMKSSGSDTMRVLRLTAKPSTSGTSIDFSSADGTGIPSWAKEIEVVFDGVSTNGTSRVIVQLGTSAGIVNTNYSATSTYAGGTNVAGYTTFTAGFGLIAAAATSVRVGSFNLSLMEGTDVWVAKGLHFDKTAPSDSTWHSVGRVAAGGTIDKVRITTVGGTETFDAGSISVIVKG